MVRVINSQEELVAAQEESNNNVFLLDFYADWCGPCRRLTPKLEELAEQYKDIVTILKVNVDDAEDVSKNHRISCMPTLVYVVNGQVFEDLRIEGADEDKIIQNLNFCVNYIQKSKQESTESSNSIDQNVQEVVSDVVQQLEEDHSDELKSSTDSNSEEVNNEKLELQQKIDDEIEKLENEISELLQRKEMLVQHKQNNY
jgi:thioredoxin 1